jgi:hypothetical protein
MAEDPLNGMTEGPKRPGAFYLAMRRSSARPSLLRLLAKVQAGTHIEFLPEGEVSNANFSFFVNNSGAYFSGRLTGSKESSK